VATFSNPASVSASRSGAAGSWVAPPTPRNSRMKAVLERVAVMVASFLQGPGGRTIRFLYDAGTSLRAAYSAARRALLGR
jgi:hypothetical protein